MLLAKVSLRDTNRPSSSQAGRLSHTVITSLIVKLMGECNVDSVAEMVKAQVGFDVVLLDSKPYPLHFRNGLLEVHTECRERMQVGHRLHYDLYVVLSDEQ